MARHEMKQTGTLDQLGPGESARIVRINGQTQESLRRRLLDMGITKGAVLRVDRHAPLGDPMQIFIKGYRLAVRMNEAHTIEVEHIETPGTTPGDRETPPKDA